MCIQYVCVYIYIYIYIYTADAAKVALGRELAHARRINGSSVDRSAVGAPRFKDPSSVLV